MLLPAIVTPHSFLAGGVRVVPLGGLLLGLILVLRVASLRRSGINRNLLSQLPLESRSSQQFSIW